MRITPLLILLVACQLPETPYSGRSTHIPGTGTGSPGDPLEPGSPIPPQDYPEPCSTGDHCGASLCGPSGKYFPDDLCLPACAAGDCDPGASCVPTAYGAYCLDDCVNALDCRYWDGWYCQNTYDVDAIPVRACAPGPN